MKLIDVHHLYLHPYKYSSSGARYPIVEEIRNKMSWRFLCAQDASLVRFIVRDIDSTLTARDRAAVNSWIAEGKKFHVIRDHP